MIFLLGPKQICAISVLSSLFHHYTLSHSRLLWVLWTSWWYENNDTILDVFHLLSSLESFSPDCRDDGQVTEEWSEEVGWRGCDGATAPRIPGQLLNSKSTHLIMTCQGCEEREEREQERRERKTAQHCEKLLIVWHQIEGSISGTGERIQACVCVCTCVFVASISCTVSHTSLVTGRWCIA